MVSGRWIALLLVLFGVSLVGAVCAIQPPLTGDPVAGEAIFNAKCVGCHTTATSLAGHQNLIVTNMGTVNSAMAGITLTAQEVADLKAFIAQQ